MKRVYVTIIRDSYNGGAKMMVEFARKLSDMGYDVIGLLWNQSHHSGSLDWMVKPLNFETTDTIKSLGSDEYIVSDYFSRATPYCQWYDHPNFRFWDHDQLFRELAVNPYGEMVRWLQSLKIYAITNSIHAPQYAQINSDLVALEYWFDEDLFYFDSSIKKKRQVAIHKDSTVDKNVIEMIPDTISKLGYETVLFDNYPEAVIAELLRDTDVYMLCNRPKINVFQWGTLSYSQKEYRLAYNGEGYSMVGAEAMCCGAVTIGFNVKGNQLYMNNQNSKVYEPDDWSGLLQGLYEIVTDSDLKENLRQAQLETARSQLRWSHKQEDAIDTLLSVKNRIISVPTFNSQINPASELV